MYFNYRWQNVDCLYILFVHFCLYILFVRCALYILPSIISIYVMAFVSAVFYDNQKFSCSGSQTEN